MNAGPLAARAIDRERVALVAEAVELEYQRRPELWTRYGERGRVRCLEDTAFHVNFLVSALTLETDTIFFSYVDWLVALLEARGIGREDVRGALASLADVIRARVGGDAGAAAELLDRAVARLA